MYRTAARQQHRSRRKRLMPLSLGSLPFASLPPRPEDVKQPLLRGRHAPQSFLHPRRREHHCQLERTASPIAFAFLEVAFDAAESIGHMGETDHRSRPGCRKGIKGGGFHLDGEDAVPAAEFDRLSGLPKWRVGCPGRTTMDAATGAPKCSCSELDQSRVSFRIRRGREIMITGALVAHTP